LNPDQLEELEAKLRQIKQYTKLISDNNFTRKTTGGRYPLNLGYASAVRRPFRDLLRWMKGVEEMLELLIERGCVCE